MQLSEAVSSPVPPVTTRFVSADARGSDGCGDLLCALYDKEGKRMASISAMLACARMPSVLQAASSRFCFARYVPRVGFKLMPERAVADGPGQSQVCRLTKDHQFRRHYAQSLGVSLVFSCFDSRDCPSTCGAAREQASAQERAA